MKKNIRNSVFCGLCIALCLVLPLAFHMIPNAGVVISPMHIPVFICGFVCGWQYGLICGIAAPILSSLMTGMPSAASLPAMVLELAVYGAASAVLLKIINTKKIYADLYISLIISMLLGRVVAGLAKALIFTSGEMSFKAWLVSYFVSCIPGIIIQLIFIPSLYIALQRARIIPSKYKIVKETGNEENQ